MSDEKVKIWTKQKRYHLHSPIQTITDDEHQFVEAYSFGERKLAFLIKENVATIVYNIAVSV